jgi:hypothetical protein
MIAQGIYVGIVVNDLILKKSDDGKQSLGISLLVEDELKRKNFFSMMIQNNEAINFRRKVSKGDLVYIQTKPFSYKDGTKYVKGERIQYYSVVKKGEMK